MSEPDWEDACSFAFAITTTFTTVGGGDTVIEVVGAVEALEAVGAVKALELMAGYKEYQQRGCKRNQIMYYVLRNLFV